MRVSVEWLKELVDIDCSVEELADKLTMSGIAVEAIEDQAEKYRGIVIAEVKAIEKHPQADHLLITRLDAGSSGIRQVITAAKNLKVGDIVPLALPGTVFPDGKRIEEVSFKGMISQGMLCSGMELGLEKESTGIWVFHQPFALGSSVAEALGETDQVLVLELTANRSDCLGMIGVAREVSAIFGKKLKVADNPLEENGPAIADLAKVTVADSNLCPRYSARVFLNVQIKPSPEWMQRRLRASGVRPINNVVDITNYVMLEYNQPLHAFDYDHITDHHVIVRQAAAGEKLTTLDGVERTFDQGNLLISDPHGSLCVAGVMGGSSSEVTDQTVNILLESAYFNPGSIRKTAKLLEMKTESSLRFERGIDPNGVINALNRAAYLMQTLAGATIAKGLIDCYPNPVLPVVIQTSYSRINQWLGTDLFGPEIRKYLERVFLTVEETGDAIKVTVPSFRRDITHMADLAEEVARLFGYERIPVTLPPTNAIGERTPFQSFKHQLRKLLQGNGLSEIITYSLYAKDIPERLNLPANDPLRTTVDLMVPLSEDQAVMRTTLTHHMLETLAFNVKRHQTDLAFYEIARVYRPQPDSVLPDEPEHLAIGLIGRKANIGWNQPSANVDFYDLKGYLELILDRFKVENVELTRSNRPFLHPGQAADILCSGEIIGYLGQVHPRIAESYGLSQPAFLMELDLHLLMKNVNPTITYKALPKFPAMQRDLALVLPIEIQPQDVIAHIKELGGELIEQAELFDVYQGEQVPKGMRSLAFSLTYRAKDRTLNDAEVNHLQDELLQKLNQMYGAKVRE